MSNESDVQEIEVSMSAAQATINRMQVFMRLVENPDFQAIIEKGYFEDEAIRLVGAKSSPALASEVDQLELDRDIMGVGRLRQYFYAIVQQGRAAEGAIAAEQEELELMRAEGIAE